MRQLLAAVGSLVAGLFTALAALFDPAFVIAHPDLALSLGFSILRGGQALRPDLPWTEFMFVLLVAAVSVTLAKIRNRRMEDK